MQLTCARVPNTNEFNLTITGPGFQTSFRVAASELKKTVVALRQLALPNVQEQPLLDSWFARIH
jgi:hypothetical protein